jgi:hypothetical protein
MKKFLIPVAVGVAVFGSVTAFAATLDVTSSTLGAGDKTVAACNSAAKVSYDTAATGTSPKTYEISSVTVTTDGLSSSACAGMAFKVTLTHTDSGTGTTSTLGSEITGTLGADGSATKAAAAGISAQDADGVAVVITG